MILDILWTPMKNDVSFLLMTTLSGNLVVWLIPKDGDNCQVLKIFSLKSKDDKVTSLFYFEDKGICPNIYLLLIKLKNLAEYLCLGTYKGEVLIYRLKLDSNDKNIRFNLVTEIQNAVPG